MGPSLTSNRTRRKVHTRSKESQPKRVPTRVFHSLQRRLAEALWLDSAARFTSDNSYHFSKELVIRILNNMIARNNVGGTTHSRGPPGTLFGKTASADTLSIRISGGVHLVTGPNIRGVYQLRGQHHGRPVYQKTRSPDDQFDVYCYFWDARNGWQFSGWWIGFEIGGDHCFAYHPDATSFSVPYTGWKYSLMKPIDASIFVSAGDTKVEVPMTESTIAAVQSVSKFCVKLLQRGHARRWGKWYRKLLGKHDTRWKTEDGLHEELRKLGDNWIVQSLVSTLQELTPAQQVLAVAQVSCLEHGLTPFGSGSELGEYHERSIVVTYVGEAPLVRVEFRNLPHEVDQERLGRAISETGAVVQSLEFKVESVPVWTQDEECGLEYPSKGWTKTSKAVAVVRSTAEACIIASALSGKDPQTFLPIPRSSWKLDRSAGLAVWKQLEDWYQSKASPSNIYS